MVIKNMKVNIEKIEKMTSILLKRMKENIGNEIELKSDFYWEIPEEDLYNPYKEPINHTLGQLYDDLEELNRLNTNFDDAIVYDLKRISSIIKALSVENPTAF